ncbi:TPA: DUF1642 domain-containing protein [Streptococcus agalactiae]|uniref:DUF1642 domain-containing protein n=2 Tax=Streptococcus agalactiae TaxID=1311 RepID=UPI0008107A51|nr:DUF1642 domain-containing protein [Streptococcus agalactiae]MDX4993970.1 DUF1642 domain-containing protein [Streptococcus agalactiae]OCL81408.1 hypothetical protein AX255_00770 [Streptococcus agalactiae]OCM86334.1 hypothetical protein AX251_02710 [Streptococcus agalactiae]OCM94377.1 hypothetical protein AX252_08805 [Streptococcus agalactiae]HEN5820844.1 DUF1642 domain-containing protein [Streptococcus agalactiae]
MNIEEAKEVIRELNAFNNKGNLVRKIDVLSILDQLDQPKPVVPQFVADWYEKNKNDLYKAIYNLNHRIMTLEKPYDKIYIWYCNNWNAIETLINMHQFGYTIEKEKLYTVEIPNPNSDLKIILVKVNKKLKLIEAYEDQLEEYKNIRNVTESEIRKDFDWAWQFREEVAE